MASKRRREGLGASIERLIFGSSLPHSTLIFFLSVFPPRTAP